MILYECRGGIHQHNAPDAVCLCQMPADKQAEFIQFAFRQCRRTRFPGGYWPFPKEKGFHNVLLWKWYVQQVVLKAYEDTWKDERLNYLEQQLRNCASFITKPWKQILHLISFLKLMGLCAASSCPWSWCSNQAVWSWSSAGPSGNTRGGNGRSWNRCSWYLSNPQCFYWRNGSFFGFDKRAGLFNNICKE